MPGWTAKSISLPDVTDGAAHITPTLGSFKPSDDGTLTPGQWAGNKLTEAHWLAGAAAANHWDPSILITEAQYDDAIAAARGATFGHG